MKKIIFLSLSVLLTNCKTLIPLNKLPHKVLEQVLKEENLPKVQFYVDREVSLHIDSAETNVDFDRKGVILQKNEQVSDDVIIRKKTKGVFTVASTQTGFESSTPDQPDETVPEKIGGKINIPVSFDNEGGSVVFCSSDGKLPFVLSVSNGKFVYYTLNGSSLRYRIITGTEAQLLVSKKILNSLSKRRKIVSGKKVEN